MKVKLLFIAIVFSCIEIHCIAQPAYLRKELGREGNISYAEFRTDTAPQPISKSTELLKSLYSMKNTDEFKLSANYSVNVIMKIVVEH